MKKLLLVCFVMLCISRLNAQTNATDFTSNDCASTSQTLFTQLDAGKVVVLVWVMPCGACTGPAKTAYNVVQSYASSNPGKVIYWLIDENNNCTGMNNWANTNSVSTYSTKFSNSAITQTPYGTSGMPKIVIAGGTSHKVYFNQNGSAAGNSTDLQAAINLAISETTTGINERVLETYKLIFFPSPASQSAKISYSLPTAVTVSVDVFNTLGEKVKSIAAEKQNSGVHELNLNTTELPNGVYYLKLTAGTDEGTLKFTVSH